MIKETWKGHAPVGPVGVIQRRPQVVDEMAGAITASQARYPSYKGRYQSEEDHAKRELDRRRKLRTDGGRRCRKRDGRQFEAKMKAKKSGGRMAPGAGQPKRPKLEDRRERRCERDERTGGRREGIRREKR